MSQQVRVEYSWLAEETRYIVASFGFEMSEQAWTDHDLLMDGCECLDRIVDESPSGVRELRAEQIIHSLRGEIEEELEFIPELTIRLRQLSDIFGRYAEPEYFISRAARIFEIAEEIRTVKERQVYIDLVCEEGRCFLEMFLPIFEVHATDKFMEWFPSVAEVGNLVDKLVDARADFRRGEMQIHPGLAHHVVLLKEVAVRGLGAFVLFPNRPRLFVWAIRFFDPRRHMSAFF